MIGRPSAVARSARVARAASGAARLPSPAQGAERGLSLRWRSKASCGATAGQTRSRVGRSGSRAFDLVCAQRVSSRLWSTDTGVERIVEIGFVSSSLRSVSSSSVKGRAGVVARDTGMLATSLKRLAQRQGQPVVARSSFVRQVARCTFVRRLVSYHWPVRRCGVVRLPVLAAGVASLQDAIALFVASCSCS